MPTPRNIDYKAIFRRVNDELASGGGDPLSDETKRDVRDHIAGALAHVQGIPGLNHHHEKLSDDDVAEVAFKYALALARGKGIDADGETLDVGYLTRQLTTVPPPIAEEEITPPSHPAVEVKPSFGHLLENPRNMNIFHGEILRAAKRPGPEQDFAQVLAEQFKTKEGRADIIRLYKELDVMTTLDSTHNVSDYAADKKAMNEFWKHLSPAQRGLLLTQVLEDDRSRLNPKRMIGPTEPAGMTRRAVLAGIGAAVLGGFALNEHNKAHRQSDEVIGVEQNKSKQDRKPVEDTKKRKAQPDDADFFGDDPREVVMKKESKEKLRAAVKDDQKALIEAVGAGALALFAAVHAVRRVAVKFSPEVNRDMQTAVASADGMTYRTKEKIRQEDGSGEGRTT